MMRSSLLFSALLMALPSLATAFGPPWWANETVDTYVNWPAEVISILEDEKQTYQSDDFPGLPTLRAFQAFPEFEPRIWPLLKSMNWRLHPMLWPHVHYYMVDGLEYGCREVVDEKTGQQAPVTTSHCRRHCMHGGRYCVPQKFELDGDGPQGKDALKEITRRLCLDTIFHAKDKRFIAYLEGFDHENCFTSAHIRNCSIGVMNAVGASWSKIQECVDEDNWTKDVPHGILDRNLRHIRKPHNFSIADMPMVTVDGAPVPGGKNGMLDTNSIFHAYCQAFPEHYERPFACDACEGCQDSRSCLWTLQCDGQPFDMAVFVDDGKTDPVNPETETTDPPHTEAPKKTTSAPQPTDAPATDEERAFAANNRDNNNDDGESKKEGGDGWILLACFLMLAALACPISYWIYRERRTKMLMAEIKAGKYTSEFRDKGAYKDGDNTVELGGRQKDEEEHYVDIVVDTGVGVVDDIPVEDLMDDDSEWNEAKQGKMPLPEIS